MAKVKQAGRKPTPPAGLWVVFLMLLAIGWVMVASATVSFAEEQTGHAFHYVVRHSLFVALGLSLALALRAIPLAFWEKEAPLLLLVGLALLAAVLLFGREINGSQRWLGLGPFRLQPSEFMKPILIIFLARTLLRKEKELGASWKALSGILLLLVLVDGLLWLEPDFGATVVITGVALGMLFLGGVRLTPLLALMGGALGVLIALIAVSPYRLQRVTAFLDPWQDPFDSGFQLTQALIAFGRGGIQGVGLGAGVQKLAYLPEAHTDFLLAVWGEEMGLLGVMVVLGLFGFLIWRAFALAWQAGAKHPFAAFLAYGLGLWLALQSFINIGVNMGLLPTKGLTLPFMSYGGSSLLASCMAMGLLLRIEREVGR